MALYVTREGPCATVNVWANLTTFGGQTLNQVVVPQGYTSIKEIWASAIPGGDAADSLGCTFIGRLTGSGIKNGPVDIPLGGWGNEQTGNDMLADAVMAQVLPVDIAVNPGGTIWVQAGQYNGSTTVGTPEVAMTLVLTKSGAPNTYYILRNISDAGTANTRFAMTSSGDDTAAGAITVPPGCSRITRIFGAQGAGEMLATTIGSTTSILLEGSGLKEGSSMRLPISSHSSLSSTTGVTDSFMQATCFATDISVVPGGQFRVYAEHSADVGAPYVAVSFEFR